MDSQLLKRNEKRSKRVMRVRRALKGSAEKPRMSVFKSNKHILVQLIDDDKGITLASASSLAKEYRGAKIAAKEIAKQLGKKIGEAAKEKKIQTIVFDRGRYKFHGLIAELANAARETGLQF